MNKKIVFANERQALLFNTIFKSEIISGYWKNARPHGHAEIMKDVVAEHSYDLQKHGCYGFELPLKYNFAANSLIGTEKRDDLIAIVKFFSVVPDYPIENYEDALFYGKDILNFNMKEMKEILKNIHHINEQLNDNKIETIDEEKIKKLMDVRKRYEKFGIDNKMLLKIEQYPYNLRELRKDAIEMSNIIKYEYENNTQKIANNA
jgi:hypothetical protein